MGCGQSTADEPAPADTGNQLGRPSTGHSQMSTLASKRYTHPEIVFDLASTGDVALLSYLWMEELAHSGMPLARRQDLPPEAFVDVTKLRAWHAAAAALWCIHPLLCECSPNDIPKSGLGNDRTNPAREAPKGGRA